MRSGALWLYGWSIVLAIYEFIRALGNHPEMKWRDAIYEQRRADVREYEARKEEELLKAISKEIIRNRNRRMHIGH